uniref:Two component transcriptional regulator, winged helix family n=1 Tax=Chlorobium phaeovibrioides (strain DSM 265 / 1930) TaxID=290318 RepID=A4SD95_CHLPM
MKNIQTEKNGKSILIVEDDRDLAESMSIYLELEGYQVTTATNAISCYVELYNSTFDLALLDLSLPDQDGLVLVRYLRANTPTAIMALSARSTIDDRRMGYDAGAHVFIAKPVDFKELVQSIAALLDSMANDSQTREVAETEPQEEPWLMLRSDWDLVSPSGSHTHLTAKERDLIILFSARCNEMISREKILKALGYTNNEYGHRSLESILYRLRKKTSDTGTNPIKTFHGNGYGFMAPLVVI